MNNILKYKYFKNFEGFSCSKEALPLIIDIIYYILCIYLNLNLNYYIILYFIIEKCIYYHKYYIFGYK